MSTSAIDVAPVKSKLSRGRLQAIAAGVVTAGVLAYGIHWYTVGRYHEETDDAYVGGDLTVIGPKVPGYISELPVRDNQLVHAGDLLVRIDDRDYRAALAKAYGTIDAQVAAVANLDAAAALQKAVVARAEAGNRSGRRRGLALENDFERYKGLVSRSAVSIESAQRTEAGLQDRSRQLGARTGGTAGRAAPARCHRDSETAGDRPLVQGSCVGADIAQLNLGCTELRADRRLHRQSPRARRCLRQRRLAAAFARPGERAVGGCELQGRSARAHAVGTGRDDPRRRAARESLPWAHR